MKIGFIGLGNMGREVLRAVARLGKHELLLSDHNLQKARALQLELGGEISSNQTIVAEADIVFLGIKPHLLDSVLAPLANQAKAESVWISMLAGVELATLAHYCPKESWIRMMPNTPVAIGQGMTTFTTVNPALAGLFEELMSHSGQVLEVAESQMDAATALAGCGPAFVYEFIEALSLAGLQQGLPISMAQELAAQTVAGAAQMVLQSSEHPAQLRDQVCSPGGSTIAGVLALQEAGFQAATVKGIQAALARTQALGKTD